MSATIIRGGYINTKRAVGEKKVVGRGRTRLDLYQSERSCLRAVSQEATMTELSYSTLRSALPWASEMRNIHS